MPTLSRHTKLSKYSYGYHSSRERLYQYSHQIFIHRKVNKRTTSRAKGRSGTNIGKNVALIFFASIPLPKAVIEGGLVSPSGLLHTSVSCFINAIEFEVEREEEESRKQFYLLLSHEHSHARSDLVLHLLQLYSTTCLRASLTSHRSSDLAIVRRNTQIPRGASLLQLCSFLQINTFSSNPPIEIGQRKARKGAGSTRRPLTSAAKPARRSDGSQKD